MGGDKHARRVAAKGAVNPHHAQQRYGPHLDVDRAAPAWQPLKINPGNVGSLAKRPTNESHVNAATRRMVGHKRRMLLCDPQHASSVRRDARTHRKSEKLAE
jgi:hypothetical protein